MPDGDNPWSLLDVRDLQSAPRSQRQRILDDVLFALCTLRDVERTENDPEHPLLDDLWNERTLDGAITVLQRMRSQDAYSK